MGSILYRNFLVPNVMVYFFAFINPLENLLLIKTGTCQNLDCCIRLDAPMLCQADLRSSS
ncbi:hypothetical protein BJ985_001638 [Corynebacterium tuberculostearicum]|nr:hypothetical protein [Corynebacterium tuberculostearicum]